MDLNRYFYPLAHGLTDFSCGLLIFRFFRDCPDYAGVLLLYNFFAFAMQMPLGILADKLNRNHLLAGVGMILVSLGFLPRSFPLAAALLAGLGNALFHLGGGLEILNQTPKAAPLGRFVAPGALGLFLGTLYGKGTLSFYWAPVLMLLLGLYLFFLKKPSANEPLSLPHGFGPLLRLFAVVILRSYIGFSFKFPWNKGLWMGLALVLATVLGKFFGGALLDRLGWKRAVLLTLVPSAFCLALGRFLPLGLLGALLFQCSMPLTLWGAARLCPGLKGFAFGLLTFALFLGFLPVYFQWAMPQEPWIWGLGALISGALLLPLGRGLEK